MLAKTCGFFSPRSVFMLRRFSTENTSKLRKYIQEYGEQISWKKTNDLIYPYQAQIHEHSIKLKVYGGWPEQPQFAAVDKNDLKIIDVEAIKEEGGLWMLSPEDHVQKPK